MWKKVVLGLLIAAGVLAAVIYSVLDQQRWHCEVCMSYKGGRHCASASGPTRKDALKTGVDAACALLTSGMDERIGCSNAPVEQQRCHQR